MDWVGKSFLVKWVLVLSNKKGYLKSQNFVC